MVCFRRPSGCVEERELGPKQPDTLGANLKRCIDLSGSRDVGEHADETAVTGNRRQLAAGDRSGTFVIATAELHPGRLHPAWRRTQEHDSPTPVDDDIGSVTGAEHLVAKPDNHRDPERSGHDRGMGRDATSRQRDSGDAALELGHLGRAEVLCDQYHPRAVAILGRPRTRSDESRGAAANAADVVGSLGKPLVVERRNEARLSLRGVENRRGRGCSALEYGCQNLRVQGRVAGDQRACLDDLGILVATRRLESDRDRIDLHCRPVERLSRSGDLRLARAAGDHLAIDGRRTREDLRPADGAARSSGQTLEGSLRHDSVLSSDGCFERPDDQRG